VLLHLEHHYQIEPHEVQVRCAQLNDFILMFSSAPLAARVLLALPAQEAEIVLRFHRWCRQSHALFSPLRLMVLLAIDNIPVHAWSPSMVHAFIGSACWNLEIILASTNRTDLSRFFVVAWAIHPDLIPNEVGFAIPEPEEPFQEGVPPLFLHALELIHSKLDSLQYRAIIHVLEVHDFSLLDDSDDDEDQVDSDSSDSGGDGLPPMGLSSLCPWPRLFCHCGPSDEDGNPLPSLPCLAGEASWPSSSPAAATAVEGGSGQLVVGPRMGSNRSHTQHGSGAQHVSR
jgi:hypothetical protein